MIRIGMKACLAILLLCGALTGSSAMADVTATFANNLGQQIVIEAAANGSARISEDNGQRFDRGYTLVRDGKVYRVSAGPGGPVAISAEAEAYRFQQGVRRGEIILTSKGGKAGSKPPSLVAKGVVRIGGYAGTRYAMDNGEGSDLVLADDPRLKPLGAALDGMLSRYRGQDVGVAAVRPMLASHGVLSIFDRDLTQVSFSPIESARFALPLKVVDLADVREEDEVLAQPAPDRRAPARALAIVKGAYRDGTLYLLDEGGAMQVWAKDADHGTPYATPGKVSGFCLADRDLWVVTSDARTEAPTLWSRPVATGRDATGATPWSRVGLLHQDDKDAFLALDCSGREPIVVTAKHLTMPISGRRVELAGFAPPPRGDVVSQVQDGMLWLGFNAGEWGGGLVRIRLADGSHDAPADVDPQTLCGGKLNPGCDPVTGLAPDPARPDCMLATIGLVHMLSHGGVVRVCGKDVSLVYAKPYTMDPAWHWDGKPDAEKGESVAFESMIADRGKAGVWAVAADGIYRFTGAALPTFTPLSEQQVGAVDWSHPDVLLVTTDMNGRYALSGSSVILVPR